MARARSLAVALVLAASVPAIADDVGKVRRDLLEEADRVASLGPYKADWESLK
jgi:hypothetical protein